MISTLTCSFLHISKWKKERLQCGLGGNEKIKRKKNSLSKSETKMETLVCQIPPETNGSCSFQNVLPKSTPTSHFFSDVQRDFMALLIKYISNFFLHATHICSLNKAKQADIV